MRTNRLTRYLLLSAIVAVVTGAVVAAAVLVVNHVDSGPRPAAAPASTAAATGTSAPPTSTPDNGAPTAPPAGDPTGTTPVRVRIPSINVDSSLQPLHITSAGVLQTPSAWQRAGWYADGVRPGNTGPALIAGHIDSVNGPAVFARLTALRPGATVLVTRADHTVLRFVVDSSRQYPKRHFPTKAVYGPTSLPVLRLVTCSGSFDRHARSYRDNLVVTTHLEGP